MALARKKKTTVKKTAAKKQPRVKAPPPTMVKRSVTLERFWDEAAHDLVGDRGFSELVNDAVKRAVQRLLIERDLAAYEAEHGAISQAARDHAKAQVEKYLAHEAA